MYTLITFIGKVHNKSGKYQTAKYRFSDNSVKETSLFGIALQEKLQVERLVVLGTSGSMWGVFVESFDLQDELIEKHSLLIDNANNDNDNDQFTQEQLDKLAPLLEKKLGISCELRLIPYGENEIEQADILQAIAKGIKEGDKVALDITHGLRHLPVITLISAFYLSRVYKVNIEGLYYGAFEMRQRHGEIVPVLKLDGLLNIANWVSALDSFDKDGDYDVFSELLEKDGMAKNKAELLKKAAFYERNFNLSKSNDALNSIDISSVNLTGITGVLFKDALEKRFKKSKGSSILERQKKLAEFYINNRDYVRGVIFLFEAFITSKMPCPSHDYKERNRVKEEYDTGKGCDAYKKLREIRNALAHGNEPSQTIKQYLKSEDELRRFLKKARTELFN
ncbi:TIGR02221 family CRISPR-associated protein [Thioflexithrix psekupsensis]|uniref:CRISPR-associated protein n=1 Tax=Thioflexithrix psekupsensis TaxID=1570016 RepID=A0A251X8B3_9GAMM|nr:TIGR02221 family CRISPR-associated protein [Thioflexithrix psekupsensis]OUD14211.1 CRISPR-associated protein [Thioflexithrix psekupsensis]